MDILIDWQKFETNFNGEKVSMMLRPLKTWAMLKLLPNIVNQESSNTTALALSGMELQSFAKEIFPEFVKDIKNLTVNGSPITFEILAEESIFHNLTMEILGELIRISRLSDGEEKNLGEQSDELQHEKLKAI